MTLYWRNLAQDGLARRGELHTAHGTAQTPAFMAVGTVGSVKGLTPEMIRSTGTEIILGNTYHLFCKPGTTLVKKHGGLHGFNAWKGPILTDSGGFQVMSLSSLRKMSEHGVEFRSHYDGRWITLSPETSIQAQHDLGADMTMAFDECTPFPATYEQAKKSMELSMRWAKRSREAFQERPGYGILGIVQGSTFRDLREKSVQSLVDIGFHAYAIGGLAVGEGQKSMTEVLSYTCPLLPQDKLRYLMGVGRPDDLVLSVALGVDIFDCVLPTRMGRTGKFFRDDGEHNIRNAQYADDLRPMDESCTCYACQNFSRAYIRHLNNVGEMLGAMMMTLHNLHYYQSLMTRIRQSIEDQNFQCFAENFLQHYRRPK